MRSRFRHKAEAPLITGPNVPLRQKIGVQAYSLPRSLKSVKCVRLAVPSLLLPLFALSTSWCTWANPSQHTQDTSHAGGCSRSPTAGPSQSSCDDELKRQPVLHNSFSCASPTRDSSPRDFSEQRENNWTGNLISSQMAWKTTQFKGTQGQNGFSSPFQDPQTVLASIWECVPQRRSSQSQESHCDQSLLWCGPAKC